ncbi:MAG: PIN domain-containing protein [Lautropia sp.]
MVVLDSNTISYYFRGDSRVVPRFQALPPAEVGVPAIAVYELRYGLSRLPSEAAEPRLLALHRLLRPLRILDFDAACAEQAATIRCALERQGTPIGPHDVLIAATALRHQARLVTRNEREFVRVPGLQVVNWHAA